MFNVVYLKQLFPLNAGVSLPLSRFYIEFVYSDMSNRSRVLPEGPDENGELLLDLASSPFSCYSSPLLADFGVVSRSLLFLGIGGEKES